MSLLFFAKQHPKMFGLQLISSYSSGSFLELRYFPTLEDYEAKRTLPTHVMDLGEVLADILQIKTLQALEVELESADKRTFSFLTSVSVLKSLRYLRIVSNGANYDLDFKEVVLKDLPALTSLHLKLAGAYLTFEGDFSNLQEVVLYRNKLNTKQLFEILNPEKLTCLYLRGCARGSAQYMASAEVGKFKNLETLNLSDNKLTDLQFSVLDLPALKNLDLSDNLRFDLPAEAMHWEQLQKLGISKTRFISQKYLKTGSDFLQIVKDCKANSATPAQRTLLFKILQNERLTAQELSIQVWGELYKIVTFLPLHQQLLALSEKFITASLSAIYKENPAFQICIAGKLQGITSEAVKQQLKTYQIKQTNKITDKTAVVCIGERADAEIVAQTIAQNLPFCTPFHLKRFLEELETPYLMEAGTEMHQNLENLLQSTDSENRLLALQLMRNGGIPPHILGYLCVELFYPRAQNKAEILALLRKYTSNETFLFLQNAYKKYKEVLKPMLVNALLSSDFAEAEVVMEAVVRFYAKDEAFYTPFAVRIAKKKPDLIWNTHFDAQTGTLDLGWLKEKLMNLPKTFIGRAEVKCLKRAIFSLQDIAPISKYKNLEKIVMRIPKYQENSGFLKSFQEALPASVVLEVVLEK